MNQNMQPQIELNNGVKIPQLGLGVWKSTIEDAANAVHAALRNGYVNSTEMKQVLVKEFKLPLKRMVLIVMIFS